jgi:hypothetical protein
MVPPNDENPPQGIITGDEALPAQTVPPAAGSPLHAAVPPQADK